MMKLTAFLSALLAVVLLAGPSFAAGTMSGGSTTEMSTNGNIATRNVLIGLDVVNRTGESIGVIRNVNVNSKTGVVNYVILTEHNWSGNAAKNYAVPLAALKILPDEGTAKLIVPQDRLTTVPAKEIGMTDETYKAQIEEHYGVAPAWHNGQGATHKMMGNQNMTKPHTMMNNGGGYSGKSGY